MKLPRRRLLSWIAWIGLCLSGPCHAKEAIIWLSPDIGERRPAAAQPLPGDNVGEQARRWFIDRLTGYTHALEVASLARIERVMESDHEATYCYAHALRTPKRAATALFSELVFLWLPSRLVIRKDRLAPLARHLNAQGEVQLASLLGDTQLRGAVTAHRNYGPGIDAMLASGGDNNPQRVSTYIGPNRMLLARRVDWTIAEPGDIARFLRREPGLPDTPTRSYVIAGQSAPVETYVMCNRTPKSRRLLDTLNQLMSEHPLRPWEQPYIDSLDAHERADLERMLSRLRSH